MYVQVLKAEENGVADTHYDDVFYEMSAKNMYYCVLVGKDGK